MFKQRVSGIKTIILTVLLILSLSFNMVFVFLFRNIHTTIHEEVKSATSVELLSSPWSFVGNKVLSEKTQAVDQNVLLGKNALRITYDLHGLCALDSLASAIIFESTDGHQYHISLNRYGKNCYTGEQQITVSLGDFFGGGEPPQMRFVKASVWYPTQYAVDIKSITAYQAVLGVSTHPAPRKKEKIGPTPTPTSAPILLMSTSNSIFSPTASLNSSWPIQSVSSMKETKDRVCGPRSQAFVDQWVEAAKSLGVGYISIETPYDNPSCGDSVAYTKLWIDAIRSRGFKVWHRHMPLAFEGIYNTAKNPSIDYLSQIATYIRSNPTFFQEGDIFTPIPEPQNGGIFGINYCSQNICIFGSASSFNKWLRDAIDVSESAFASLGLGGKIKIGYYGFDGFIAWGDNNPDWNGILEDATVQKMGNITIDHYPEIVGDTMQNDLDELAAKYPTVPIIIGEWGTITGGGSTEQQVLSSMQAAKRPNVAGFNYWHMGMGGYESLINEDFSHKAQYDEVQSFFAPH